MEPGYKFTLPPKGTRHHAPEHGTAGRDPLTGSLLPAHAFLGAQHTTGSVGSSTVLAGPASGASASPAFRALVDADIPSTLVRTSRLVSAGSGMSGGGSLGADLTLALATPGTLTATTANSSASPHTHAVTSASNAGAAASLLATGATGLLQLLGLGIGAAPTASQLTVRGVAGLLQLNQALAGSSVYIPFCDSLGGLLGFMGFAIGVSASTLQIVNSVDGGLLQLQADNAAGSHIQWNCTPGTMDFSSPSTVSTPGASWRLGTYASAADAVSNGFVSVTINGSAVKLMTRG